MVSIPSRDLLYNSQKQNYSILYDEIFSIYKNFSPAYGLNSTLLYFKETKTLFEIILKYNRFSLILWSNTKYYVSELCEVYNYIINTMIDQNLTFKQIQEFDLKIYLYINSNIELDKNLEDYVLNQESIRMTFLGQHIKISNEYITKLDSSKLNTYCEKIEGCSYLFSEAIREKQLDMDNLTENIFIF